TVTPRAHPPTCGSSLSTIQGGVDMNQTLYWSFYAVLNPDNQLDLRWAHLTNTGRQAPLDSNQTPFQVEFLSGDEVLSSEPIPLRRATHGRRNSSRLGVLSGRLAFPKSTKVIRFRRGDSTLLKLDLGKSETPRAAFRTHEF